MNSAPAVGKFRTQSEIYRFVGTLHNEITNFIEQGSSWKVIFPYLIKKFPQFNAARRFFTVFTRARH